jgi:hypothetical protein
MQLLASKDFSAFSLPLNLQILYNIINISIETAYGSFNSHCLDLQSNVPSRISAGLSNITTDKLSAIFQPRNSSPKFVIIQDHLSHSIMSEQLNNTGMN